MSAPVITIGVTPARGGRGYWVADVGGRVVAPHTLMPFLDAARALLAEGVDAETIIEMSHVLNGGNTSLRAKLGVAAGLTVRETGGAPRFVPWKPFERSGP